MIIGIDPGATTGIAVLFQGRILDAVEVPADEVVDHLRAILVEVHEDVVVEFAVERYVVTTETAKRSQQPDAQQVIGQIRGLVHGFALTSLHLQNPADAKKCAPNKVLRKLGWPVSAKTPHANDALRHVALRLVSRHPSVYADLLGV